MSDSDTRQPLAIVSRSTRRTTQPLAAGGNRFLRAKSNKEMRYLSSHYKRLALTGVTLYGIAAGFAAGADSDPATLVTDVMSEPTTQPAATRIERLIEQLKTNPAAALALVRPLKTQITSYDATFSANGGAGTATQVVNLRLRQQDGAFRMISFLWSATTDHDLTIKSSTFTAATASWTLAAATRHKLRGRAGKYMGRLEVRCNGK